MQMQILPQNFIAGPAIPVMDCLQSDFVLKALRFVNDSSQPAELTQLTFELFSDGTVFREIVYNGQALLARLKESGGRVKNADPWGRKSMLGSSVSWAPDRLSCSCMLRPAEEAALTNEFFISVAKTAVDQLGIRLDYRQGDDCKTKRAAVPVVNYRTSNIYHFPVKGVWQVNGNYDCYGAHRSQYSMEFAIDLGKLDPEGLSVWKSGMRDEESLSYAEQVLAIGDGEVVDCFNEAFWRVNFPVDTAGKEEKAARAEAEKAVGRLPIQCGNYAVIKHANSEYSFYGHMIRHSVTVQKGDLVRRGDALGRIGNVGFSGAPHLHFHLMDGPDFYSARGLPCHFANLTDCFGNEVFLIQEEYTIVKAE